MYVEFFPDHLAHLKSERYNFIKLVDVIKYIANPQEFLAAVADLLDCKARLLEPTHLCNFKRRGALQLFREYGLQLDCACGMRRRSWFLAEIPQTNHACSPATVLPLLFNRESLIYHHVFELRRSSEVGSQGRVDAFMPRGTPGWLTMADYCVGWLADLLLRRRFLHRIVSRIRGRS